MHETSHQRTNKIIQGYRMTHEIKGKKLDLIALLYGVCFHSLTHIGSTAGCAMERDYCLCDFRT